ncbi:MAG TPA: LLM class flavin-dependent oxidoreductase [Myxococcota bacterium]|nr:LLM class flavin-dependent oxidoreductase [Myxococcota bacterium]
MSEQKLATGIFLAPFHPVDEDPTLALRRDLELVEYLDQLGYAEAWIGEHHSAGYEIIASPELFIAAAAERTQRIKLGTGVISLPYHNPLMVADRMLQLDHMTQGRAMFGVGPGLLPSDAHMLGIPVAKQRDRMVESLEVILRLLAGEVVTAKTEWFELRDARCQLRPYTRPRPHIAVASTVTPSGGRAAGRYGLGMLCVASTQPDGYDALAVNWKVACDFAAERGGEMRREELRLVAPVHVAETREQARKNVAYGLEKWTAYFNRISPAGFGNPTPQGDLVDGLVESGRAVIGTPDDAVAMIERLEKKTGGFGVFLQLAHNWADFAATKKSYELFARHVTPRIDGANRAREQSLAFAGDGSAKFMGDAMAAAQAMIQKHAQEEEAKRRAR